MKYMGSKRWMLQNGLGDLLANQGSKHSRFFDLFSGSGAVINHVASKHKLSCFAYDLQDFSVALNSTILTRTSKLDAKSIWTEWETQASQFFASISNKVPLKPNRFSKYYVDLCRTWCALQRNHSITQAYGGHYFSPTQALWIDSLRACLPKNINERRAALAALIQAASQCSASPGHTAQPFQPTKTAKPFIEDAWSRSVTLRTKAALDTICDQHALCLGGAAAMDANEAATLLIEGDLVFLDPPYSGVHYSRFYHVLESIARGACSEVTGRGRYPSQDQRPISKYSIGSEAPKALDNLLSTISQRGATAILTFPSHQCSNGLSGTTVKAIAREYFEVTEKVVESKFSTLGGNSRKSKTNNKRDARQRAYELILYLVPR